jgi:hypothetical protein
MKLSRPLADFIGTFQSLNNLVANPSGLAIFLCPPFGQSFGVGHFFMPAAAPPFGVRRQFSSSGARDAMLSAMFLKPMPDASSQAAVRATLGTFLTPVLKQRCAKQKTASGGGRCQVAYT